METTRFDEIASTLAETSTRRGALRFLAAAAFGLGSVAVLGHEESAARRRRGGKKKNRKATSGSVKAARQICTPGRDTCSGGLQCDAPTTRHTCSSTVEGIDAWCCLPAGSECHTECDCCGNYYCSYDDNNVGHCEPNPEG
jgi:hypothetical protein